MTPEEKKAYMLKWRKRNRARLLESSRNYYRNVRKNKIRIRRRDPQVRCALCSILLISRFGGKNRRKYCDSCVQNYARQIYNAYQRRRYQKSVGNPVCPLSLHELLKK